MRKGIVAGAGYCNGINNIPLSRRYVRHGMHLWVSYIAFGRNIILYLCGKRKCAMKMGTGSMIKSFVKFDFGEEYGFVAEGGACVP